MFGTFDPHVPLEGREQILAALDSAGVKHKSLLYEADHTFMRNDGYRYDPEAADEAWSEIIEFFESIF